MMVGDSAIGSGEPVLLPGGEYRVRLNSSPPLEVQLKLVAGEKMTMTFEKKNGTVFHSKQHRQVGYIPCTEPRSDQSAAL
jgi:hypothetical protein